MKSLVSLLTRTKLPEESGAKHQPSGGDDGSGKGGKTELSCKTESGEGRAFVSDDFQRADPKQHKTGEKFSDDSAYASSEQHNLTSLSGSARATSSSSQVQGQQLSTGPRASFDTARARSSLNEGSVRSLETISSAEEESMSPTSAALLVASGSERSIARMGDTYPIRKRRSNERRVSLDSGWTETSRCSGHSRRSSFALERASLESNRASLDRFRLSEQPSGAAPASGDATTPTALCESLNVPSSMQFRFLALAVVPVDTPLPMGMLRRLWSLQTDVDAQATASSLVQLGLMKLANLADDTAWALVQPGPLKALHEVAAREMRPVHAHLLAAYAQPGAGSLADIPDDGYIMQNVGHHLVHLQRLPELRQLLARTAWLEAKLHSYGVASVVADFRRYLMVESNDGVKLLLEAFQMSVSACLEHPKVEMLHAQLAGRLLQARAAPQVSLDDRPLASGGAQQRTASSLRTRTASLEQAGGLQRMTLRGHTGGVKKVLLTPGGIDIITSSVDGTSRVWDMEIGDCVLLLEGHSKPITDMATAANGSVVVTASEDATARVWDLEEGRCLKVLNGHDGAVNSVAVDHSGKLAVTAGEDGVGRVWDVTSGDCIQLLLGHTSLGALHKVVLSRDGARAVTCSSDFSARAWQVAGGNCLHVFSGHAGWVVDAALTPDASLLVTASHDGTSRVWDMLSGRCVHVLSGHTGRVNAVRVADDSSTVISVSDDFTAKVYDLHSGSCRHTLEGHGGWVSDCAIAPGLDAAVTASGDDLAVVWDILGGGCRSVLEGHSGEVHSVVLTRRGRFAVTGSTDGTARVWDLAAAGAGPQRAHGGRVYGLVATPDGASVVCYGDSGCTVWDAESGSCSATLNGPSVRWAACLADGRLLCASGDRTTTAWNLLTSESTVALPCNKGSRVKSWAASKDGKVVVVVLFDSTVTVWDLERQEPLTVLQRWGQRDAAIGHTGGINAAAITSDGRRVLTASKDCTARIWDVALGTTAHVLKGHSDGVTGLVISDDDQLAVSLSYDLTARLWSLASGECLGVLPHSATVTSARFSADAGLLLTTSADNLARLWCLRQQGQQPRALHTLQGHKEEVRGTALSSDNRWAATCSRDNSLRLWDCTTGHAVGFFAADAGLNCCLFVGQTLCAGNDGGVMHFLELPA